ncbi:MAG: cadmium-translocating P-type ATPase [Candidatus Wildermuthbacteria bacterium]|nr:cadmium-translocating P-type ATPase [Candidatus Wildermuthbacteria bacterium]
MPISHILKSFKIPLAIILGIGASLVLMFLHGAGFASLILISITILGSYELFKEIISSIAKRRFVLDYIAVLAIIVALATKEYLVASIIALMISSGRTLEEYGVSQAKNTLTKLADRIPHEVLLWEDNHASRKEKIGRVAVLQEVLVRKGEVIGLDGNLMSPMGIIDEASLTGEPYPVEKIQGDSLRSGTINIGEPIVLKVSRAAEDSMYEKIIAMVKKAQQEKAPLVRLADSWSVVFTFLTLLISAFAYLLSHDFKIVLAVLVIATPCPLLLATPIALLGGVNASAKKRIIVKKLASLEVLSRINAIIFDKTGTITLGKPTIAEFKNVSEIPDARLFAVAESIERNSMHPLANAIVSFAKERQAPLLHASSVQEKIGSGISGVVEGMPYALKKIEGHDGMTIGLHQGETLLAVFRFQDELRQESREIMRALKEQGLELHIFTGDKKEAAEEVAHQLGERIHIQAECTPQDKQKGIEELRKAGKIVAMIGDGINDAPALALANVGIVFSNEEQTAASEAADIVFLGGNFSLVIEALSISKRTVHIAIQSIAWGIGMSVAGMILAAFGFIPPIAGAFLQEAIDVAVIVNALRASR